MPTLKQFRYLVAIAETLNFRRAAGQTHVSQPTLSAQLRLLEHRLGVQLVERSRTRVLLTPLGKEIVERARLVLREVDDIVDVARRDRQPLAGRTRLGVLPTLGPYLLPHLLPEIRRRYPALRLHIREELTDALIARLEAGTLDLVVTALPLSASDLDIAALCREPLVLVAPRDHPLAVKRVVRRRDLAGEGLLTLESGHHLHREVRALCTETGATVLADYEGTSLDTLRQMVGMGVGIAFLPALYARMEASSDRQIGLCRFVDRPLERTVVLAWRRSSPRRSQYGRMAQIMRRLIAERLPEVEPIGARSSLARRESR